MNIKNFNSIIILTSIAAFTIAYLYFYPNMILIVDEQSYFNRAMQFINPDFFTIKDYITHEISEIATTNYLLGTAFWLSILIRIGGVSAMYISGLLSVTISVYLSYLSLKKLGYHPLAALFFFITPSILFFSRTIMSGLPSLMVSAIFFYLYFAKPRSIKNSFLLAFTGALSLVFRETNGIVFFPFLLFVLYYNHKHFLPLLLGGLTGLLPRFVITYLVYGSAMILSPGESFQFANIISNFTAYTIIGLVIFPGLYYFIASYRGQDSLVVKLTVILFVLVYLLYGYNAVPYSGYVKGSLVLSRFLFPLMPLMVISLGYFMSKYSIFKNKIIQSIGTIAILVLIIFSQYYFQNLNNRHHKISETIYNTYQDDVIIYDQSGMSSIYRYINPYFGKLKYASDLMKIKTKDQLSKSLRNEKKNTFFIISERYDSPEKLERNKLIMDKINNLVDKNTLKEMPSLDSKDGTIVRILKIK